MTRLKLVNYCFSVEKRGRYGTWLGAVFSITYSNYIQIRNIVLMVLIYLDDVVNRVKLLRSLRTLKIKPFVSEAIETDQAIDPELWLGSAMYTSFLTGYRPSPHA